MWNSTSRVTEAGTKYEIGQLDLLVNFLGTEIKRQEDSDGVPLAKDDGYEWHYSSFLNGITNGEFLYCAFEILNEMLSDEQSKPTPMYKEAVLASILDCAEGDFLDRCDSEFFDEETAKDVWELWKACRANKKRPVWEDENGQSVDPPLLKNIPKDQWEFIFEFIFDDLLWDRDWEIPFLGGNLALVQEQPHWPTLQEFRTAKTWLLALYENTRINREAKRSQDQKAVEKSAEQAKPARARAKSKKKTETTELAVSA